VARAAQELMGAGEIPTFLSTVWQYISGTGFGVPQWALSMQGRSENRTMLAFRTY
jgi:hypothetical protein